MQNLRLGQPQQQKQKYLWANHFPISLGKVQQVYSYHLKIREIRDHKQPREKDHRSTDGVGSQGQEEQETPRIKKKRIIYLLLKQLGLKGAVATDYVTQLIVATPLDASQISNKIVIDYYDEYSAGPSEGCRRYDVVLEEAVVISLADLFAQYRRTPSSQASAVQFTDERQDAAITALNIIFSHPSYRDCFSHRHPRETPRMATANGHTFYGIVTDPTGETATGCIFDLSGGLYSIPGFSRSVRAVLGQGANIHLNINTATACFWKHGSLQELIESWKHKHHRFSNIDPRRLMTFLDGVPVRVRYHEADTDSFSGVRGLPRNSPKPSTCPMQHPQMLHGTGTVAQYYRQHHNWTVNDHVWVVLVGRGHALRTVPADLLDVLPGRMNRNHDEKPVGSLRFPGENYRMIVGMGRQTFLGGGGAGDFDVTLARDMLKVPVRILDPPELRYNRRGGSNQGSQVQSLTISSAQLKFGSWNLEGAFFVKPAKAVRWACVEILRPGFGKQCAVTQPAAYSYELERVLKSYGISDIEWVGPANDADLKWKHAAILPHPATPSSLEAQYRAIRGYLEYLKQKRGANLCVLLLPTHDVDLYSAIKRAGDQDVGIATVCHVLREDRANRKLVAPNQTADCLANLSMKINLKTDPQAVNQALQKSSSTARALTDANTMIIGIDVTHPGATAVPGAPSVAAVVGSVDATFAQWPASLQANISLPVATSTSGGGKMKAAAANERILDLTSMTLARLRAYHKRNGVPPSQIIVYRDGLSESQFSMCVEHEFPQIQEAVARLCAEQQPQTQPQTQRQNQNLAGSLKNTPKPVIILICAVKRHHTRLFPAPAGGREVQSGDTVLNRRTKNGGVNDNPLPGCLVTEGITYGTGDDFFLVSQQAIQGTARPTHYKILVNQSATLTRDDVARFTHHLCFLFGRSTRSVGVCPAVYYADLAADRARCYVRAYYRRTDKTSVFDQATDLAAFERCLRVHPDMADRMFYI